MKRTPQTNVKTPSGPRYWRGLDELADTPEFKQWIEREFPQGASEWSDPVSRRHFVKIMSASFLLAGLGLTGCRRPEEIIYPFAKMPEDYVHGVPRYFATAMPGRRGAQALVVKSMDGRPIKIEGNPRHPLKISGANRFAQASILDLYDVDRAIRFLHKGTPVAREAALDYMADFSNRMIANGGQGLCFLADLHHSPSGNRLQRIIQAKLPKARWFTHQAVDQGNERAAARRAFGAPNPSVTKEIAGMEPYYRFDRARVIVSLDCDFLGESEDDTRRIRDFAKGRRINTPSDTPNRLYAVEPLLTLTGVNADHRLRLASGQVWNLTANLAAAILSQSTELASQELLKSLASTPLPPGVKPEWIKECAADLLANPGASLVVAGERQPETVHLLVIAINRALGNEGATVEMRPCSEPPGGSLTELAALARAGEVKTLVISGGNPVYTAGADLDWPATQARIAEVVRLGYHEDETAALCQWHFPATHYLESWGDARTFDGTLVPVQPLIAPLFDGLTELEFFARLAGLDTVNPNEIVRTTFKPLVPAADFELEWQRFLRDGFLKESASRPVIQAIDWPALTKAVQEYSAMASRTTPPSQERLEIVYHRDYSLNDGSFNNNGWLQEMPDPITKLTWENVVTMSATTARTLGVFYINKERGELNAPIVEIEWKGRKVEAPVWIQPGQADFTLGLALGYGRRVTGHIGKGAGFNAYSIRDSLEPHFGAGARVKATGHTHPLSTTQSHWAMEGRPIVREANLDQFRQKPGFAAKMDLEAHEPDAGPLYLNPMDRYPAKRGIHQWGMSVDLNACVGCSACVMACQSENNIPIVGKDQVARGREMHWIRIDRYYNVAKEDATLDNPQVVHQPMLCQHCENAPCENVCPVNATVHDEEGLNMMVYNRCVGTRYCANNCPYKVRRFNFFDFNQRPLDKLYWGPLTHKGMPDLIQMAKNPDVTVRMRGVMEKCTFCVQRIEEAKINQKIKAGPSPDVRVPDGTITPACAQTCPAEAIVFGDLSDPNSRVSQMKSQQRNYSVLGFLNTKPRTTYLARIRNPNPRMPDYHEQPLSRVEYERLQDEPENAAVAKGGH